MMRTARRIWAIPILLGVLTLFGLLAALLGAGLWHWLAWAALAIPLAAIVRHVLAKKS